MNVTDFEYELPSDLIAQHPPEVRGESRLLVLDRSSEAITHARFRHLPERLRPSDLMVLNDTRVFAARLIGRRVASGGQVECLLLRQLDGDHWEALVHPGRKLRPGSRIEFVARAESLRGSAGPSLQAEILEQRFFGRRVIRLWTEGPESVEAIIDAIGHVPLPPYIKRADALDDRTRYQTVYAGARGSVAAPTAGLHFTDDMLASLERRGVEHASLTLHVGYGTFKPVRVERVEDHEIDPEPFELSSSAASAVNRAMDEGRRVLAVGTTTTRALETAARADGRVMAGRSTTDLFIYPGFEFRVVGALLTNFHLPRSSLLMLVAAFAGRERVLAAYCEAVREQYRFYSYGDAMLIL
ncbi:MAG: tRNA preQ1(34) S-adenosylmethionine ribosyltransferase-isomerase QueA [Acidobacteria bacterium]|nr:tRNA preQ1(34) S-adenosylmethionine ribosyltransferase-isomerase QueA [Acidobacteriota bacterium]MBI3264538.1 tRNA preQ1(34) S-adenosylmethionine ribosyltransferase-isomerase QueA [Acidobacteriota bacterium]